jgi:hypothetical protein
MSCCQHALALGQQTLADGVQNTWARRPLGLTQHRNSRLRYGQRLHHRLPCLGPVRGSLQLSRVSAVASTGLSSSSSAAQQHMQYPASPSYGPPPAASVTVTWPGLLAALGLAATALVAAATTCFFLYLKPVMQVSYRLAKYWQPCHAALSVCSAPISLRAILQAPRLLTTVIMLQAPVSAITPSSCLVSCL